MIPVNINRSGVLACVLCSPIWQAAGQIKQHGSSKGLATEGLCAEESAEGRMGPAEGPLASIPWAYNKVGPNYCMQLQYKDISGDLSIALSRDELLATFLTLVANIFFA